MQEGHRPDQPSPERTRAAGVGVVDTLLRLRLLPRQPLAAQAGAAHHALNAAVKRPHVQSCAWPCEYVWQVTHVTSQLGQNMSRLMWQQIKRGGGFSEAEESDLFTMLSSRSSPGATCICSRDVAGGADFWPGSMISMTKLECSPFKVVPAPSVADLGRVVPVDGDGVLAAAAVPAACPLSTHHVAHRPRGVKPAQSQKVALTMLEIDRRAMPPGCRRAPQERSTAGRPATDLVWPHCTDPAGSALAAVCRVGCRLAFYLWRFRTMTTPGHRSAMASTSDSCAPCAPGMLRTAFLTFLHVACRRHSCSGTARPRSGCPRQACHVHTCQRYAGTCAFLDKAASAAREAGRVSVCTWM